LILPLDESSEKTMIECARPGCGVMFEKTARTKKYHDNECCKKATSEKAMAKYYERKARKSGKKRPCRGVACSTLLSRYNESKYCQKCLAIKESSTNKKLLEMIS
jgi:hypothetical protein